jgi:hypothetical protein
MIAENPRISMRRISAASKMMASGEMIMKHTSHRKLSKKQLRSFCKCVI